ncbi:MAG: WD40 repeat-like protein [Linnemannia gamsii]|nr:MAG: WD40 repeat-like protein [Linnemannia gamsii]
MKSDFKFSNLCGTVYKQGNLVFTPDGNSILSPVGNRLTVFDLVNNKAVTFPYENRKNIDRIALSPNATLLISVDEDGRALLVNYNRQIVLHHFNFKNKVYDLQFSPDGKYFAVTHGKQIQLWKTPGFHREFTPIVLHRTYTGHYDEVTCITWSPDSKYFLTTSKDMSARVYSTNPIEGFVPFTLSGHRDTVIGAWFSKEQDTIYTVSKDGALFEWRHQLINPKAQDDDSEDESAMEVDDGPKRWSAVQRHFFYQDHAKVVCAAYHAPSAMMVVGFSNGVFGIWELPSFNNIHTLSISQKKIDSVTINKSGEWLAFGASKLGQLLVWEWQSESYVLKQQGHFYDMNCLSYSSDGQSVVTGGDDGKVKVWNTISGFCFVTFSEHTSRVTATEFAKNGQVVFSASLDGTVRAFDLVRYRNFRTFTSPTPVQFSTLAVDPSGEVVCAGAQNTFEIYVWSVQTGKLLDILAGHTAPISGLAFSPTAQFLASSSWDRSIRTWDVFGRGTSVESFTHLSEVLALAFRPDGKELCGSTLDGQLSFWDAENALQTNVIDGRRDISGGRKAEDKITAENSTSGKHFNSLCYTADGSCIIGGGNSKYVCIYDIKANILVKKWQISKNLSFDGTLEFLNSKNMTEAGAMDLIDDDDDMSDLEDRQDNALPGTKDLSKRNVRPEIRTKAVRFSPTGRSWAAASTEGLLIYSLDDTLLFDPFDLEIDITPETILETLDEKDYLKALVMAFRLNERQYIQRCYEAIPPSDVRLVARQLPSKYLERLMKFIASYMEDSPHLEFHLIWCTSLLISHGKYLKDHSGEFLTVFRGLQKGVGKLHEDLAKVCNDNTYTLEYLLSQAQKN